jgi:hypothetical protein
VHRKVLENNATRLAIEALEEITSLEGKNNKLDKDNNK